MSFNFFKNHFKYPLKDPFILRRKKSVKQFLSILILLVILAGCTASKEADPPVPKTGVELVAIGPTNFGGVIVGNYRDAAIRVFNYGPEALDTSTMANSLTGHFHIQSVGNPCATGTLNVGSSCVVSIRFQPTISGQFYQDFIVGGSVLRITGRGQVNGNIEISDALWDTGQTVAGQEVVKNIFVTNQGDFPIQSPSVQLVAGLTLGFNNCGTFIQPQASCRIELLLRKTLAGNRNELITFQVPDSYSPQLTLVTDVIATEPAGLIEFNSPPESIIADGTTEMGISTQPVKDQYGNVVLDNTSVRFSSSNCTIISDNAPKTISGVVTVIVRTSSVKGNCTLSAISAQANGILNVRQTAGPPYGTIQVEPYTQEVVANGQTQIVFKTLTVRDQFNNIVENGTEIYFSLVGNGYLSQAITTTVLGKTQVILSAPSTPGTTQVVMRAGPVRDSAGNIIAYSANGVYQVNFTSGSPNGNIPITSQYSGIYAVEDSSYEEAGYNIHSIITIGPVKDANGNVVSPNTAVNVVVTNGTNVTMNGNNVTAYTDSSGQINFLLAGSGNRGYIGIQASTLSGAQGSAQVWAFKQESLHTTETNNKVELFEIIKQNGDIPARTESWVGVSENYIGTIAAHDSTFYKVEKVAYSTPQVYAYLPFLLEECMVNYGPSLLVTPCRISNATNWNNGSPLEKNVWQRYGSNFNPTRYQTKTGLTSFESSKTTLTLPSENQYGSTQFNNVVTTSYDQFCASSGTYNQPIVFRNAGIGMIENLDKILIFGGFYYHREGGSSPSCLPSQFPSGQQSKISSIYTGVGQSEINSNNSFLTRQNGEEDSDVIGDYPPSHGNMRMISKGSKILGFGGYLPIPGGSAFNQLYVFNGTNNKWSVLRPDGDPVEVNTGGEPESRYQNGFVYVPELNNIYVVGGLKEYFCGNFPSSSTCTARSECQWESNSCYPKNGSSGTGWETAKDVWELNLDSVDNPGDQSLTFKWKKLCGSDILNLPAELGGGVNPASVSCGLDIPSNTHDILSNEANGASAYNRAVTNVQAVYNKIRRKIYLYWADKAISREFSPFSKVFPAVVPTDGAQNLQGAFQVIYNEYSERMLGYFRENTANGHSSSNNPLKVFDVVPGDKYYFKSVVDIGPGAKVNAKALVVKVSAKAKVNIPPATGDEGVEVRLFNFTSNAWELVGSHNMSTDTAESNSDIISFTVPPANITNYISTQGKIEIMVNPKGSLSNNSQMRVWINQMGIDGIF